jgi:hypothetical protein
MSLDDEREFNEAVEVELKRLEVELPGKWYAETTRKRQSASRAVDVADARLRRQLQEAFQVAARGQGADRGRRGAETPDE